MILDGVGHSDQTKGNAVKLAKTPNLDSLMANYPNAKIQTSGLAVGLPWGVRGNSEVGHQTIGSGQIIFQFLPTITAAIFLMTCLL